MPEPDNQPRSQADDGPCCLPLLDAEAARAGDAAAVDAGDTWAALMERAAGHLARGIVAAGGHGYGLKVAILVGKGNNGGDGWAAARRLRARGAVAWVVAPDGIDGEVSAETATHRAAWIASGGRTSPGLEDVEAALRWADVGVDALLGTGSRGAPRGPAAAAVAALRRAHDRGTIIVACDVPSGVTADDGSVAEPPAPPEAAGTAGSAGAGAGGGPVSSGAPATDGSVTRTSAPAVMADVTVTFGALKRGLLLSPGAAHTGRVVVGDLGERYDPGPAAWSVLTPRGAAPPSLAPDADKLARGVVLGVAGAIGTAGAAALTAGGTLRAGAGLVTVAVPDLIRGDVAAAVDPGVMIRPLHADESGAVSADAIQALPDLSGVDTVVAGPGLGHGDGTRALVQALRATSTSLVLDVDALNVHRDAPEQLADHQGVLVLTPHERELARIGGGEDGPDARKHRVERVPGLARDLDATIVVKGPGTMVVAPDGRVWVCPLGGPALGSGGTGDVLAGVVGAAVAAAMTASAAAGPATTPSAGAGRATRTRNAGDVPLAVARAVWWHAAAGLRAGARSGGRATATDLLAELPGVLADLLMDRRRGQGAGSARTGRLPWEPWRAEDPAG